MADTRGNVPSTMKDGQDKRRTTGGVLALERVHMLPAID